MANLGVSVSNMEATNTEPTNTENTEVTEKKKPGRPPKSLTEKVKDVASNVVKKAKGELTCSCYDGEEIVMKAKGDTRYSITPIDGKKQFLVRDAITGVSKPCQVEGL